MAVLQSSDAASEALPLRDGAGDSQPSRSRGARGPWVVAALAGVLYLGFALSQWQRYVSLSWDLGIFTQRARQYAQLEAPIVTIKGEGFNLLGDHFHPLLAVLGPVYALFPSAVTLLVVQVLLLAGSVLVIAREAARRLEPAAGVAVGGAYAVSFGVVGAMSVQFHEIAFAMPLLALSLVALRRRRGVAGALWAAPLVLVKEDLGLTVAVLGAVLAWRSRRGIGLALVAWGAGWFALTTYVLIPALSTRDQWDYGSKIDVGAFTAQPWLAAVALVDDKDKIATLLMLVAVTGLIGLRSPILLVAAPTIAWRFLADNEGYWTHTWHYSAVLMPIAFVALLDGIRGSRVSPRRWLRRYSVMAVPVAATVAVMLAPQLALHQLTHAEFYQASPRAAEAAAVLEQVPDDVVVETDVGLMSYLVDERSVYFVGAAGNPAPDYLLIDEQGGGWNPAPEDAALYAEQLHPGVDYRLVHDQGGFQLAERTR